MLHYELSQENYNKLCGLAFRIADNQYMIERFGINETEIELTTYKEPILSTIKAHNAHPTFNKMFLNYEKEVNNLIISRKSRSRLEGTPYLATTLYSNERMIEFEINKEKFIGRGNLSIPQIVKNSIPLSKKAGLVTEGIVAIKRTVKIKPEEEINIDFILSVGEDKEKVKENIQKYETSENVKNEFDISKARVQAESRYLRMKGKQIALYQKMLSYIVFDNAVKSQSMEKNKERIYKQEELWKYGISGDLPIILVKIRDVNDIYVIKEVLKAYEFFRTKNIQTEIVILDEEKHSYENYVKEEIESSILSEQIAYLKNIKGGIYTL